jgi:hypothetical protein
MPLAFTSDTREPRVIRRGSRAILRMGVVLFVERALP